MSIGGGEREVDSRSETWFHLLFIILISSANQCNSSQSSEDFTDRSTTDEEWTDVETRVSSVCAPHPFCKKSFPSACMILGLRKIHVSNTDLNIGAFKCASLIAILLCTQSFQYRFYSYFLSYSYGLLNFACVCMLLGADWTLFSFSVQ